MFGVQELLWMLLGALATLAIQRLIRWRASNRPRAATSAAEDYVYTADSHTVALPKPADSPTADSHTVALPKPPDSHTAEQEQAESSPAGSAPQADVWDPTDPLELSLADNTFEMVKSGACWLLVKTAGFSPADLSGTPLPTDALLPISNLARQLTVATSTGPETFLIPETQLPENRGSGRVRVTPAGAIDDRKWITIEANHATALIQRPDDPSLGQERLLRQAVADILRHASPSRAIGVLLEVANVQLSTEFGVQPALIAISDERRDLWIAGIRADTDIFYDAASVSRSWGTPTVDLWRIKAPTSPVEAVGKQGKTASIAVVHEADASGQVDPPSVLLPRTDVDLR